VVVGSTFCPVCTGCFSISDSLFWRKRPRLLGSEASLQVPPVAGRRAPGPEEVRKTFPKLRSPAAHRRCFCLWRQRFTLAIVPHALPSGPSAFMLHQTLLLFRVLS